MERIGPYLKNGRLAKGYSQEELARKTKIPLKYIQALEEERFNELPEPVYTRGFVRAYCKEVGLEPDPVLGRLQGLVQRPTTTRITKEYGIRVDSPSSEFHGRKAHSRVGLALVFLVFILGVLFVLLALTQRSNLKDVSQVTSQPKMESPSPVDTSPKEDPGPYFF